MVIITEMNRSGILASMKTLLNESLAPYTSLRVGGPAEKLIIAESYDDAVSVLSSHEKPLWVFGFGCNVLISDNGLPGTTLMLRGGDITVEGEEVVADAGVWWDDAVRAAIAHNLWGLELMSEIPSSVGGAVVGNIAAYGQQVSDSLAWLEIFDADNGTITKHDVSDFDFNYRQSSLQQQPEKVILRVGFKLSRTPLHELKYDSAVAIATELGLDQSQLDQRREIIIETRRRAGSIYHPDDPTPDRTAGSFFKNPLVEPEQAKQLANYDETGKTLERIERQSQIHGGSAHRASAAHVLLAAGFKRGQTWQHVQLHPSHVLKLATLPGASASEVYDIVQEIVQTVQDKLGIKLEPEVRFIGQF